MIIFKQKDVKELEKENKRLKKVEESLRETIESSYRTRNNELFYYEQRFDRNVEIHKTEIVRIKNEAKEELRANTFAIEETADNKVKEAKERFEKRVDSLKDDLAEAGALAKEADVLVKLFGEEVIAYKEQVSNYKDIITELMKLLPKVDMSKFNINVDVPKQDVVIKTIN